MAYNAKVSFCVTVAEETRFPTPSNRVLSSFPSCDRNHRLPRYRRWRASSTGEETFILGSFKGKQQDSATPVFWPRIDWLGGTLGCHLAAFLVVALCC
jgi:hypothetical protein